MFANIKTSRIQARRNQIARSNQRPLQVRPATTTLNPGLNLQQRALEGHVTAANRLQGHTNTRLQPQTGAVRLGLFETLVQLKAHEDEKSLCNGDWNTNLSLDQPTYGSVFLQIREANTEADGSCEFVHKTADILASTILVTIILGSLMTLPVAMISVGVKYLEDCPKEPKVPIYLLVGGCFGLLKVMSLLWKQVKSRHYEKLDEFYEEEDHGDLIVSKSSKFSETVLSLFLFAWFLCGNYWVFHIYKPSFEQPLHDPNNWCDQSVYMFALIQICGCYCLMGLIVILTAILALCHHYTNSSLDNG